MALPLPLKVPPVAPGSPPSQALASSSQPASASELIMMTPSESDLTGTASSGYCQCEQRENHSHWQCQAAETATQACRLGGFAAGGLPGPPGQNRSYFTELAFKLGAAENGPGSATATVMCTVAPGCCETRPY